MKWRLTLDAVWLGLGGDAEAFRAVSRDVAETYISPQWHNEGQDGPDDLDDDPAAATLYAATCYLHGCVDCALGAATRELDAAYFAVQEGESREVSRRVGETVEAILHRQTEDSVRWALAEPVQAVLRRQATDLEYLRDSGIGLRVSPDVAEHLRR